MSVASAVSSTFASSLIRLRLKHREEEFVEERSPLVPREERERLIKAFSAVDRNITSAHSPAELLFIARTILALPIGGAIVECGSYKGASTAKLSLIAKATGRKLYVCDTFQGLPEPVGAGVYHRANNSQRQFQAGEYAGSLQEVRENIRRWGSLEVCSFVQGLFEQTLPQLHVEPAAVFVDVDYISSARDCLKYLWPQLRSGGYFFTHEATFVEYVEGIADGDWWHENLGRCPPVLFGAGYGVESLAPYVAFFRKRETAA
ncbi:MAG: TylF/MycF/NovP-related O-methyltransferase [Terriglobia bacterium]